MKLESLHGLFLDELADIYSAEQQLVKALPKMAKAAAHPKLRNAFESHLTQTEGHVQRLEAIFARLSQKPKAKTCKAMKGLIEEGAELTKHNGDSAVLDAALIAAAQRVEHYEIAAYGCARTFAELLGDQASAEFLSATLDEEKKADENLTMIATKVINPEAARV